VKRLLPLFLFASLGGAIACGPSKVNIAPSDVTRVELRPASGQGLFCPGDPFQVELIARLKDGTACSSSDRKLGCKGVRDAVIDPSVVRLQAWPGELVQGHDFTWRPDADPLRTAATGLLLRGWIEKDGKKSVEGKNTLKPVYACQSEHVLGYREHLEYGGHGGPGPVVHVYVTTLSTPFYANAALIRIESQELGLSQYAISPSSDKPVRIVAMGQDGARGFPGASGHPGSRGANSYTTCGTGGRGGDGGPGGYGGPGGEGGQGGVVHVHLDASAADALAHRVQPSAHARRSRRRRRLRRLGWSRRRGRLRGSDGEELLRIERSQRHAGSAWTAGASRSRRTARPAAVLRAVAAQYDVRQGALADPADRSDPRSTVTSEVPS